MNDLRFPKNDDEVRQSLVLLRDELKEIDFNRKIVEAKIRAVQEFCSHPTNQQHHDNDPRGSSSHCKQCGKHY